LVGGVLRLASSCKIVFDNCYLNVFARVGESLRAFSSPQHLDIESIDALITAINEFEGGVVCVTHDARLILVCFLTCSLVSACF
jgi:hypothetical protein